MFQHYALSSYALTWALLTYPVVFEELMHQLRLIVVGRSRACVCVCVSCVCVCECARVCVCVCTCNHACMHEQWCSTHTHICTHVDMRAHYAHVDVCMHVCSRVYVSMQHVGEYCILMYV